MKKSLTIAGFDPSGGAGLQADLKVFHSLGVYGLSVVSSLTAQNTEGVSSILPVDAEFIKKQLTVLLSDIKPDAVKIGMLYAESNVKAVAGIIKKYSLGNIVIDPVILSSSGKRLAGKNAVTAIRKKIFPFCKVITPNIHEASFISGVRIKNITDMERAAVCLKDYGAENVIVTGGHLEQVTVDVFYNGNFHYLKGKKISGEYHGTGCMFSAAITAFLARGNSALKAAKLAKEFMNKAFRKSFGTGGRMRLFDI